MATPLALEADREEQVEAFHAQAEEAFGYFAENGLSFTMDDVRKRMTVDPPHENMWGSLTRTPLFKSLFEDSGLVRFSRRRAANKRRLVVWQPVKKLSATSAGEK